MKHIIFSTYDDLQNPYYGGGGALVFHEVAKRLAKEYTVTVYTGSYPGSIDETIEGVLYRRIGPSWTGPLVGQLLFPFFLLPRVIWDRYIIWFESFTPPWSASVLPLFARKPFVGVSQFLDADAKSKQYRLPFFIIEKINIQFYKYAVALTSQIKHKLLKLNSKIQTFIIPNGVDTPHSSIIKINEKPYLLYIGRIEINQKGIDLLLTSFAQASKNIKEKLYIAGTGQLKELQYIQVRIKELQLQKRVVLLGKVTGFQKQKLLSKSKYIVIPSRYESLCIVGLEALVYGKPVVCFNIPGLEWMPNNTALKIKAFSEKEFANAIVMLSKRPLLRKRMGQNAYRFAKQYSWERVSSLYKKVIITLT